MSNNATHSRRDSLVAFFVLTFAITWGLGALLMLFPGLFEALFGPLSAASPAFVLAVAGPTLAATILTAARHGWAGLCDLYARLAEWRFGLQWYAAILVGVPLASYLVSQAAGAAPSHGLSTPASVVGFLLLNLILGPLGEELGWRGFAFPRLLRRFSPMAASLILGAIWGVWHLPAFFLPGLPQADLSISVFLVRSVLLAILGSWIFLHTGGNVPSMVLFHYAVNISINLFGAPELPSMLVMAGAAALVIVLDRRVEWFRKDADRDTHPALAFRRMYR
jgi:membrane protease YdiL (CAAX protease family)